MTSSRPSPNTANGLPAQDASDRPIFRRIFGSTRVHHGPLDHGLRLPGAPWGPRSTPAVHSRCQHCVSKAPAPDDDNGPSPDSSPAWTLARPALRHI
jgi:hypothetical protein